MSKTYLKRGLMRAKWTGGGGVADDVKYQLARQQGEKAGLRNKSVDVNPYRSSPGAPEYVRWLDGHDEGLAQLAEMNPSAAKRQHASDGRERDEADLEQTDA